MTVESAKLFKQIYVTKTKRWQDGTYYKLSKSGDNVPSHTYRCMLLLVYLVGKKKAEPYLTNILLHDVAETFICDLGHDFKKEHESIIISLNYAGDNYMKKANLPRVLHHCVVLKAIDALDAILWAKLHGVTNDAFKKQTEVAFELLSNAFPSVQITTKIESLLQLLSKGN